MNNTATVPPTRLFRLPFLLVSALCVLLAQCANTDPGFQALVAQADPNPPKDAIVGMWHKRQFTTEWMERPRCSLLFSRDGTGVYRLSSGAEVVEQDRLAWTYEGGGVWSFRWLERGEYSSLPGRATCRLTRGCDSLLWMPVGLNWVFDRVE